MDTLDRELLSIIQADFPLDRRPYRALGERLGIPESDALARVKALVESGIIRRIGPSFDSRRLGYVSALAAMKVPSERLEEVAAIVSSYPQVTHNYGRAHEYNLWFTLVCRDGQEIDRVAAEIRSRAGIEGLHLLPAERVFKIRVEFEFVAESCPDTPPQPSPQRGGSGQRIRGNSLPVAGRVGEGYPGEGRRKDQHTPPDEIGQRIIAAIQAGLPLIEEPFRAVADDLGMTVDDLLRQLAEWKSDGTIRRFGAILRHREAGYTSNAMGAWNVPDDQVESFGGIASEMRAVSHCYQRPRFEGFPYNLYTMIHGRSREECERTARLISEQTGITDYQLLYTTKEFKKSSPAYFE